MKQEVTTQTTLGPWLAFPDGAEELSDSILVARTAEDCEELDRNMQKHTGGNLAYTYVPMSSAMVAGELVTALRDMVHYDDLTEAEKQPAVERARAVLAKVGA